MFFKRKGDKTKYSFIDWKCIGRRCWAPGMYQHRSPLSCGGSRNTGSSDTATCMNRAYRGCPEGPDGEYTESILDAETGEETVIHHLGVPLYQIDLAEERKLTGWKAAYPPPPHLQTKRVITRPRVYHVHGISRAHVIL